MVREPKPSRALRPFEETNSDASMPACGPARKVQSEVVLFETRESIHGPAGARTEQGVNGGPYRRRPPGGHGITRKRGHSSIGEILHANGEKFQCYQHVTGEAQSECSAFFCAIHMLLKGLGLLVLNVQFLTNGGATPNRAEVPARLP